MEFLTTVRVAGGGDEPEDFVEVFELALKIDWSDGAKSVTIIVDASPHGKRYYGSENQEDKTPQWKIS
jgi:hypothetical protein